MNPVAINFFRTTTSKSFWANHVIVTAAALVRNAPFLFAFCISDNNENLAPYTNLALLYHSSVPCRVHSLHIQYCWYPQYWIFGHITFVSNCYIYIHCPLALKIHIVIEKMLCEAWWYFLFITWYTYIYIYLYI